MLIPVEKLKLLEDQVRIFTDADLDALMVSMREIGILEEVVIDTSFTVLSGTLRYLAIKKMGWAKVPCRFATTFEAALAARIMSCPKEYTQL